MDQNVPPTPSNIPPVAPRKTTQKKSTSNSYIEILKFALVVIIIFVPIRLFIAKPFIVSGPSMFPTFQSNQYLIVDQLSYDFENPQRGDVIVFKYPLDTSLYYIKRIVGLPGDTIVSKDGVITITPAPNPVTGTSTSFVLDQSYLGTTPFMDNFTAVVATDSYFVMGDNRPVSSDSRYWGDVPRSDIVGRPIFRLFPPNTISVFPGRFIEPQE